MLSNISWADFITVSVVTLICYYAIVAFLYYKEEIAVLLNKYHGNRLNQLRRTPLAHVDVMGTTGEAPIAIDHNKFKPRPISEGLSTAAADRDDYKEIFADIQEGIKVLFSEITRKESPLDELKIVLPAFLEQYGQIAESRYRSKVNDYILEQCHSHLSLAITEDEINDLW